MVLNLASGKIRRITDGKWFALSYTGNRHHPYSDIGLVSA